MSALPIQYSSAAPKWKTRLCSRKRPRIDRTWMFSESPGRPGRIAQIPRTTMSTGTPACDARYSASITCSSTSELSLNRTRASSLPSRCASISSSMRRTIPRRTP